MKQSAFSCALTALIGGVTEPALFGITIPLKTPLYGCMIGGLVGGAVLGLKKVVVYSRPVREPSSACPLILEAAAE